MKLNLVTSKNIEDVDGKIRGFIKLKNEGSHPQNRTEEIIKLILDAKETNENLDIYTQQDTVFNVVSHLIHHNLINYKNVTWSIYENGTVIKDGNYNKEGLIKNWEYGFFLWELENILTKIKKGDELK